MIWLAFMIIVFLAKVSYYSELRVDGLEKRVSYILQRGDILSPNGIAPCKWRGFEFTGSDKCNVGQDCPPTLNSTGGMVPIEIKEENWK